MADAFSLQIPFSPWFGSGPSLTGLALNDTDNAVAAVFQAENTEPITHIGVRHTSTTGTSPIYIASVQGVSTTGNPDGTVKGGGSPCSKTFSPSSLSWGATTWQWIALDNAYTPTVGEVIALVVTYSSGTVSGANFSSIAYYMGEPLSGMPYALDFQTAWTKRAIMPAIGYKTATRSYGYPQSTTSSFTFTSSGTNEYGFRFTLPTGWSTSYKIAGCSFLGDLPPASTFTMKLYDGGAAGDTTVLQTLSAFDGDVSASTNRPQSFRFTNSTLATLTPGNTYRIAFAPVGAVVMRLYYVDVATSTDFSAHPFGDNCCITSRAGGNWTDTTTRRPLGSLIVSDLTASGGGSHASSLILGSLVG